MNSLVFRRVTIPNSRLISRRFDYKDTASFVQAKTIASKKHTVETVHSFVQHCKKTIPKQLEHLSVLRDNFKVKAVPMKNSLSDITLDLSDNFYTKFVALKDVSSVKLQLLLHNHFNTVQLISNLNTFITTYKTKAIPIIDTLTDSALDLSDKMLNEAEILSKVIFATSQQVIANIPPNILYRGSCLVTLIVTLSALNVIAKSVKGYALRQIVSLSRHVLSELNVEITTIQQQKQQKQQQNQQNNNNIDRNSRMSVDTATLDPQQSVQFTRLMSRGIATPPLPSPPLRRIKQRNTKNFTFYTPEDISTSIDNTTLDAAPSSLQEYSYDDRDVSPVIIADREESPFIYEDFELFVEEKKGGGGASL